MKFNSKAGQELRTWILFFVGIGLAVNFALNGNPLNPWWTLVIGGFTSAAVIVSAVQALTGGVSDVAKKAFNDTQRKTNSDDEDKNLPTVSTDMGIRSIGSICFIRSSNPVAIFAHI